MKRYLNLLVAISPVGDGQYDARVTSEEGTGTTRFTPPFQLSDIISHAVGPTKWRSLGTVKPLAPQFATARDCGVALFETLFTGTARDLLVATEARASTLPDTGVRIRLAFDLTRPGSSEVAALPWELMRRRDDDPLVVTMQTALVRALDVPKPIIPRPFIKPLRILVIRSNPEGTGALNLAKEGQMLISALNRLPGIKVDEVEPVAAAIRDQLAREDYHVIHYMGHGDFQADRGGMLLLENEDNSPHLVSAATFAAWLKDEPLRLVFLNACETGTTPEGAGLHPFAGVAAALIQGNTPAVVAMQFPISDSAAIEFARTFYTRIADGYPVDAAVAEGRKALFDDEATEWATPVLYLRPDDGNLFDDNAPEPTRKPADPVPLMPAAKPGAPPRDTLRTLGIAAMGALALIVVVVLWAEGFFGGQTAAPEAVAAPAATLAEEAAKTIADETSPAAVAINNLPTAIWINDDQGTEGHTAFIAAMKANHPEMTDAMIAADLRTLAEAQYPEAQYLLARIYDTGGLGLVQSSEEANVLLEMSAEGEIAAAQYLLGHSLLKGEGGMDPDLVRARSYLEKAAAQGNRAAQADLDKAENWQ
ncbi:CHAT domain-containing protein [Sandarakinorhabdus rubra]|uniref:CHAT domain-containing protein n=1 Tax=Sandarakinorhabdus rubra TaxID=2672568 RepID=UPI0013D9A610|nr:CHAT domain-containing protein [Sandarakinorhabdus rubra]